MGARIHRRNWLRATAGAGASLLLLRDSRSARGYFANERLGVALVGLSGRGQWFVETVPRIGETVVALCDVNQKRAAGAFQRFPVVPKFQDFRRMLAEKGKQIDALFLATPDHTHAVITMAALKKGMHVYCEKPLTYSVYEARQVAQAASQAKVATQLGNQGQATEESRVVRELILAGPIGPVREVHVWSPARFWKWPAWEGRPAETPPVPEGLDWDLWLGPAPERPYHPAYCPWTWRNWWDFGTGLLGDLGCHKLSTVFKALKLGHPVSVEACCTKMDPEIYPLGVIARFEFPERDGLPPVTLTWHDGGLKPPRPAELEPGRGMEDVIYVGEKGKIMGHRLIPESRMQSFGRPPKVLPRSVGHHKEWIDACRGGPPAGANFPDHAGLLTEVCMLGNVALRAQKKLSWDGAKMRVTNDEAANRFLHRPYRQGWTL